MKRLIAILIILCLTLGGMSGAFAGTVETAQALAVASQHFNDAITGFNNEQGEDGSARGLKALFDKYGLSNPPTLGEYNSMSANEKAKYYFELRNIINRALKFEALHEEFIIIDPGTGAFGNLAAVKVWAEANMGAAGVQVGKNTTVLGAVRAELSSLISNAMLEALSNAITGFRDKVTETINERGTG